MNGKIISTFSERLNEALEIKNISPAELSRQSGIIEATISNYRKGKYKPKQPNLEKIAKALNVSVAWLLGVDVPMQPSYDDTFDIFSIPGIEPLPETTLKPLLGTIACGEPILAEENIEEMISIPTSIHCDFALRCQGNCMVGARILDGDIVFIRKQPDVENGEIAAILIDNEVTLKRFYFYPDDKKLVLQAENPTFAPLVYIDKELDQIKVLGKAVAFQSSIK